MCLIPNWLFSCLFATSKQMGVSYAISECVNLVLIKDETGSGHGQSFTSQFREHIQS